jgi:hypothetical protein
MTQGDVDDNRRKSLIFQRRQIQNEKNIEEIVRTNTDKVIAMNGETSRHTSHLLVSSRHSMNVAEIIIRRRAIEQS